MRVTYECRQNEDHAQYSYKQIRRHNKLVSGYKLEGVAKESWKVSIIGQQRRIQAYVTDALASVKKIFLNYFCQLVVSR